MPVPSKTIYTSSGRLFPLEGGPQDVDIDDIAHALSMQCRFTGHIRQFYSVAQHSVWVARYLQSQGEDKIVQAIGLLHDASEAYLSDLARPFKGDVQGYRKIENAFTRRIFWRFGIEEHASVFPLALKEADMLACFLEAKCFHAPGVWTEFSGVDDVPQHIGDGQSYYDLVHELPPLHSEPALDAKERFLDWYQYYVSREVLLP